MKLISPFRDYYDGLAALDRDPTPVYLRNTEETYVNFPSTYRRVGTVPAPVASGLVSLRERWYQVPGKWSVTPKGIRWDAFRQTNGRGSNILEVSVLGFCGRLYPIWHVRTLASDNSPLDMRATYTQTREAMEAAYAYAAETTAIRRRDRPGILAAMEEDQKSLASIWNEAEWAEIGPEPFRHWGVPVFVLDGLRYAAGRWVIGAPPGYSHRVVLNPKLEDLSFAKVMDPQQAWQAIDMFLSSALAGNQDVPQRAGGDADIAYATGHDPKTSFRKAKTDQ